MKKGFFLTLLLIISFTSFAQKKFTISGTIRDQKTGETLIGATLILIANENYSVLSNAMDFILLQLHKAIIFLLPVFQDIEMIP